MTGIMFVGVDVSRDDHTTQFLGADGTRVARMRVGNTPQGATSLIERLVDTVEHRGCAEIRVGMEATNLYWWHLFHHLYAAPELERFHLKVALINPARIKAFKQSFGDLPKTDRLDALIIAEYMRFNQRIPFAFKPDPRFAPIQKLTRARFHLAKMLAREKNRALSLLYLGFSAYGQNKPFSDVFGATSTKLLSELTLSEMASLTLPELAERVFSTTHAYFKSGDQERILDELAQLIRGSYRLDALMEQSVHLALRTHLQHIRFLEKQINMLDREIAERFRPIPSTLQTIAGLGPVLEAGIRSELEPIERFDNDGKLAKFAGLVWRNYQSGKFDAQDRPLTRSGNRYLRYYLVEAANFVRVHDARFGAYYQQKYDEASDHRHKRAIVLTARKLTRTVYVLLKRGRVYDPERMTSHRAC